MSTQKFMDSAGIKHLWEKITQAIGGGVSEVEAAVEELANALAGKVSVLPYTDYGTVSGNYSLPVINVGELRPYKVIHKNTSTGTILKVPSGGRYIVLYGHIEGTTNEYKGKVAVVSGGSAVARDATVSAFYLRVE